MIAADAILHRARICRRRDAGSIGYRSLFCTEKKKREAVVSMEFVNCATRGGHFLDSVVMFLKVIRYTLFQQLKC